MKKFIRLSLLAALSLVGCQGGGEIASNGTIKLMLWDDGANLEFVEDLVNNYLQTEYVSVYKKAPTVKIEYIAQTEQHAIERLGNLGPTGNGPDILAIVHNQIGVAMNSKWISPVSYTDAVLSHHSQSSIDAFSLSGKLYGYPTTAESVILMYDESQLSASDVTSLEGIHNKGKKISWQLDDDAYYPFAFLNDVNLFGPNGTSQTSLTLNTTQAVDNLYYIYGANSLARNTLKSETPDDSLDSLRTGATAGVVTTPYLWNSFKEVITSKGGTPKVATLPTIKVNDTNVNLRPFSGYKGYAVSAFTKYPHLCQGIASYLANWESQIRRTYEINALPTITDNSDLNALVSASNEAIVYEQQVAKAITMPNIIRMEDFWAPGETIFTNFYNQTNITKSYINDSLVSWQADILSKN